MVKIIKMKKCIICNNTFKKCKSPRCLDCRKKRKKILARLRGRKHYKKHYKENYDKNNKKNIDRLKKKNILATNYYANNKDKVKSRKRFRYRIKQLEKKLIFKISKL